jgi:hypothetical protein
MSQSRKRKRAPKQTLALPDLEQSKAAVLNTLTSKSGKDLTIAPSLTSLTGTVRSHGFLSTEPSFSGAIDCGQDCIHVWRLASAKIGQPSHPLIIANGLDRGLPSTLGTTPFVESFLYGIKERDPV